ncbi:MULTISPECIES: LUD domain-containing protein [unclassified Anaeromyxobacter]|uniref:LutC/YkgG family protein n=1 Tax=unclassified Anaeromyxobacter TaxID=2620896 RepID=UPI001F596600|nr:MULTISPECIES: LUD domain-containing protein [unclassified Anaeromyxobacter]
MSSREEILQRLRAAAPPPAERAETGGLAAPFADRRAQFEAAVVAVAGAAVRVATGAALAAEVAALAERLGAKRVASAVTDAGPGNVALDALGDPHELEGIDLAVLPGVFGVAENGAVWVSGASLHDRAVFVVTQHLALVVPASEIVNDMHEACARVAALPRGYGLFIAGPSKTADIEQALVIGAHGARSCTVFVVG